MKKVDIEELKSRISVDLKGKCCLKELTKEIPVSAQTLRKLFRRRAGFPISDYIQDARVAWMIAMLEITDKPCKNICIEVGLREDSGARAFKKATGMTMMEWRRRHGDGRSNDYKSQESKN